MFQRRNPQHVERRGELVVVIRHALVGVAVDRGLKNPVVVVIVAVVDVFLQSESEYRYPRQGPQQ